MNISITELRKNLIEKLKQEISFLEQTSATDEELKDYKYCLNGDLSDYRRFKW